MYLVEAPEGAIIHSSSNMGIDAVEVFVDSDWAGCRSTRKSTIGSIVYWGGGIIKTWSRTQGTVAISSGEAEFYAVIKGLAEKLGIQSLIRDLGIITRLVLHQGGCASKGTLSRTVGRLSSWIKKNSGRKAL